MSNLVPVERYACAYGDAMNLFSLKHKTNEPPPLARLAGETGRLFHARYLDGGVPVEDMPILMVGETEARGHFWRELHLPRVMTSDAEVSCLAEQATALRADGLISVALFVAGAAEPEISNYMCWPRAPRIIMSPFRY